MRILDLRRISISRLAAEIGAAAVAIVVPSCLTAWAIPLQDGVANGVNDGSELARFGAMNVGLAWPLRCSHSPVEVIDPRDLRSLLRIVVARARAPSSAHNQSRP
jgi:putative aminopeptidase FrvX